MENDILGCNVLVIYQKLMQPVEAFIISVDMLFECDLLVCFQFQQLLTGLA